VSCACPWSIAVGNGSGRPITISAAGETLTFWSVTMSGFACLPFLVLSASMLVSCAQRHKHRRLWMSDRPTPTGANRERPALS
jgi:hypothetical protein